MLIRKTAGRIVRGVVPPSLLFGTKLGDWYNKNPSHKFEKGEILILKDRRTVGYGIRPVIVVNDYKIEDTKLGEQGFYYATVHMDADGNFAAKWVGKNQVPKGVERTIEEQRHFKWNIENQFKKVPCENVNEALALYRSVEV